MISLVAKAALVVSCVLFWVASPAAAIDIDPLKHDALQITAQNFDTVIGKHRSWQVAAVLFYKPEDTTSQEYFLMHFNDVAAKLKRMVKLTALNCEDWPVFCQQLNVQEFPSVMVYPRNPIPPYFLDAAKRERDALSSHLLKLLSDENVKPIKGENMKKQVDTFLATDSALPKVILLGTKSKIPPMFKALSTEFRKDMRFAYISSGEDKDQADAVLKRFKGKAYPSLIVVEGSGKASVYKGKMEYVEIADWVNLKRETFMSGGGFDETVTGGTGSSTASGDTKPWLVEEIPEMTKASHQDICMKKEGLCVIYLTQGEIGDAEVEVLRSLKDKYVSHLDGRGINLKWMWMDMALETEFSKLFDVSGYPSVVVLNPHKRLRFTKNDDAGASQDDITRLIEKIQGGDARFKMVKGQKLPAFADRKESAATGKKEEL